MSDEVKVEQTEEAEYVIKPEDIEIKYEEPLKDNEFRNAGPEEVAAQLFFLYQPKFKMLVQRLPLKALRRVINALMEYPIQQIDYKHQSEGEKNAFLIGDRLLEAKYLMIIHAMHDQIQARIKTEQEAEEKLEIKGEDNGTTEEK